MVTKIDQKKLEELYNKFNRREYVHPDPLEFLYDYPEKKDREIAGIIASSLAYGNVKQILKSVAKALKPMSDSPYLFLRESSSGSIHNIYKDFKHRFTTGEELSRFMCNLKEVLNRCGSLEECFYSGIKKDDKSIINALEEFTKEISPGNNGKASTLIPSPTLGSACKRLNLFLRWMARFDDVDPGGWDGLPKEKLIIPLDVHMFKIGHGLGFTKRKQAGMRTAIEITKAFKKLCPEDPIKYDFSLTRFGIRSDMKLTDLIGNA